MKLYRGIKNERFEQLSPQLKADVDLMWKKVIAHRAALDFSYPSDLNTEILSLSKLARLSQQHFTDRKDIAASYAKMEGGVVVEIDVPEDEIVKYFRIEFQNFAKRKENFELVYVVQGELLAERSASWKLKVLKEYEN